MHLITRFNQGGTAQWLKHLVSGLELKGIEGVIVIGNVAPPEVEDRWLLATNFRRINSLSKRLNLKNDLLAFLEIRKLILELRPAVLNTHTSKAGVLGRLAARSIKRTSRPYIVHTYHGHLLYGYFGGLGSRLVALIERLNSKFTDHFIVSGQRVAEELLKANIIGNGTFNLVTPGLPISDFPTRKASRREFDLRENNFVVGWLGRLTDIKDPEMLLEIATFLPNITFLVGGEGELYESVYKVAPANVRMVGWVKQDLFWSACDVAILTSKNEAQPYSLIEAIHAGKPVIARNVGSVQDVLSHGSYGFLFNTVQEAVGRLKSIEGDSQKLVEMSEAAALAALSNFSLDHFIDAHILVYTNFKNASSLRISAQDKNRKIEVCLRGGIGNQLFQYFAGHELSMRQHCEIQFDDSLILNRKIDKSSIHSLNTVGEFHSLSANGFLTRVFRYTDALQFRSLYLNRILSRLTHRFVIKEVGFSKEIYRYKPNSKLIGYFQSWKHHDFVSTHTEMDLLKPFATFTEEFLSKEGVNVSSDIAVHIRRGDYVSLQNTFGLLDRDYYHDALNALGYESKTDKVWVFTDATEEQVGQIFDLREMKVRILSPSDGYSDIEHLALMAKFRRIVVANSSYSWWAAKLSQVDPKVVAPYNWYKSMKKPIDLIPDDWIQVKNMWL